MPALSARSVRPSRRHSSSAPAARDQRRGQDLRAREAADLAELEAVVLDRAGDVEPRRQRIVRLAQRCRRRHARRSRSAARPNSASTAFSAGSSSIWSMLSVITRSNPQSQTGWYWAQMCGSALVGATSGRPSSAAAKSRERDAGGGDVDPEPAAEDLGHEREAAGVAEHRHQPLGRVAGDLEQGVAAAAAGGDVLRQPAEPAGLVVDVHPVLVRPGVVGGGFRGEALVQEGPERHVRAGRFRRPGHHHPRIGDGDRRRPGAERLEARRGPRRGDGGRGDGGRSDGGRGAGAGAAGAGAAGATAAGTAGRSGAGSGGKGLPSAAVWRSAARSAAVSRSSR